MCYASIRVRDSALCMSIKYSDVRNPLFHLETVRPLLLCFVNYAFETRLGNIV